MDPKALAKFADRLPSGTLAIQYFAAPDTLYLFVVAPGGSFQVRSRAIAQEDLYTLVKEYRQLLNSATTEPLPWIDDGSAVYREKVAPLRQVSRKLSALLLEPVAPELATHRNLVLIPNDMLLYLPIHALTLADRDGSVRFLVETHVVSYVTQLELVDLLTPSMPETNVPLLAVGNPDGSLPAAGREVRDLARLRSGATALEGAQATKERFVSLAAQFPDVHLATHGVLDAERPERSYLLLAGADEASQRLSVAEIASLSLGRNGLAVLSACETALGEQVPGAALTTLAAAFSQAGAQSVVASLWKVNDETTRHFMVAFHRSLATSGRAAALQQAQLTILRQQVTAHPFYWAPFILIGGPVDMGGLDGPPKPPGWLGTPRRSRGAPRYSDRLLVGFYRQGEREGRAGAELALHPDSPAVELDELPESVSPRPVPSTFFVAGPTCRNSSNTAS